MVERQTLLKILVVTESKKLGFEVKKHLEMEALKPNILEETKAATLPTIVGGKNGRRELATME